MSAAASPSSQSELVNRRLAVGLTLSLVAHALLLSLQFGVPGLGPGAVSRLVVRLSAPLRPQPSEPAPPLEAAAEPVAAVSQAPAPPAPVRGLRLVVVPPVPPKVSPAKRIARKRTGRPVTHPKAEALSERVIAQERKPEASFSIPQPEPEASTDSATVALRAGAEEGSGASIAGKDAEQRERVELAAAERRLADARSQAEEAAARQAQEVARQLEMAKLEQQRQEQEQERQAALRAEQQQAEQALASRRDQERMQHEEQLRAAQEAQRQERLRLAEQERTRAQEAAEALARQQEREREAAAALVREQEQQRVAEAAARELARQRAAREQARLLAEQRAAQDRLERQRQAEEQERQSRQRQADELAAQQRAEEERLQAELRQREALAAQQKAQQEALRREAEDAARRRAEQLAQRQAEELARQRAQAEARRAQDAAAGQETMAPGAGAGAAFGGSGLAGGRPGRTALGSELGNRARELVRGLGVLGGAPPVARVAEDESRQRRRAVSTGAERDVPLRLYIDGFRQKIERNGTLNGGQLGDRVRIDPVVSVALRSDGSVEDVMIVRSSGHAEVDAAVRRIVRLNERYAAFPPNVAALYDVIEIRRIWTFANGLKLLEEVR